MVGALVAFAGAAVVPGILCWLLLIFLQARAPLIAVAATHHTVYLLCAGLMFRLLDQPHLRCAAAVVLAMVATTAIWIMLRNVAGALDRRCDDRQTVAILILAIMAVLPSAYIYIHQGYFPDGSSFFSPGISNDQLRNSNLIAALAEKRQSVYFPNSELIYQVAWHQGVANATAFLAAPDVSSLPRALGASLVTGALCYASILWLIVVLRGQRLALWGLVLIAALALSEADVAGAIATLLKAGRVGIAADGTSLLGSPYRYFSLALVTITAPQHATFFIPCALAAALSYRGNLAGLSAPLETATIPGLAFAAVAGATDPILLMLAGVPIGAALLLLSVGDGRRFLRVCGGGIGVVLGAAILHQVFLGFSVADLFLRPRLTGAGSGFGIDLFGHVGRFATFRRLAFIMPESLGVVGAVFGAALVVAAVTQPRRLLDPLPIAGLLGLLIWNLVFVGNEIQRHFSMIGAVMAVVGIGLLLPPRLIGLQRLALNAGMLLAMGAALYLHSNFTRRFAVVGKSLPAAAAWPDYFCVGKLIRERYPGLAVVTRTPDNFELPIAVEFTTAMVWSQIAFVHQRVSDADAAIFDQLNSRDSDTFKQSAAAKPQEVRGILLQLGFKGLLWGPVEEAGWGPAVRQALVGSDAPLASCGQVSLYALPQRVGATPAK
jgi:hypothetical protein